MTFILLNCDSINLILIFLSTVGVIIGIEAISAPGLRSIVARSVNKEDLGTVNHKYIHTLINSSKICVGVSYITVYIEVHEIVWSR